MMNHLRASILLIVLGSGLAAHEGDPKLLDLQPPHPGPGWRNALMREAAGGGGQNLTNVAAEFPHSNVTLLAWMPLGDFQIGGETPANGNSCFGYTSPSGREYAIFGHQLGTAFVEVTNPGNPHIVAQIPGPASLWRDMRVFSTFCYAVSEGGGGIQVINLAQIDNGVVTLANTIDDDGTSATHTLALNVDSGYLYRAGGSSNGLRIYNLNVSASAPQRVGTWASRYVHEAQIVTYPTGGPGGGPRELAICCGGLNGGFSETGIDIVDVTNKASPQHLLHVGYGQNGYSHQAWLSPDRQFLYHNDETDGRPFTRVFDASQLNSPQPVLTYLGEFQNGVTVDHNLYTRDARIYESNYRSGLRVFDRSASSLDPQLVAWFDTYPADDDGGYNGLWNNYPYFASRIVLGSDINRGFFVWWVGTPPIAFSFPQNVPTLLSPAGEALRVDITQTPAGSLVANSAKLNYKTGAVWNTVDLVAGSGNAWQALFPALPCGTSVDFYFSGETANGVVWTSPEDGPFAPYQATVAFGATTLASFDFETQAGWLGTAPGDTATSGLWTRVNPNGTVAQPADDHSPNGTFCFVTGQGTSGGSSSQADVDGGFTTLTSPTLNLAGVDEAQISYWRWYSNDTGSAPNQDTFRIAISNNNGASWTPLETVGPAGPETAGGWFFRQFRIADFVTPSAQIRVRFQAEDAGSGSIVEAAVDDVRVLDVACGGAEKYCFGDGFGTPCPCANNGSSASGCAHSGGVGAALDPSGTPSVSADTLALAATSLPAGVSVLFFQGSSPENGGLGVAFGDGLRCAGGTIVRLATKTAVGTSSSYPQAGDPSISTRGLVPPGALRYYQAWYRNNASFCTSATFNLSNGVSTSWAP